MDTRSGPNADSTVRYLLDATHSAEEARLTAKRLGISQVYWLSQRDSRLGWIGEMHPPTSPGQDAARRAWRAARPIFLPGFVADAIPARAQEIAQAMSLMQAVLGLILGRL